MKTRIAPPGARWHRRAARSKARPARWLVDWTIALVFATILVLARILVQ